MAVDQMKKKKSTLYESMYYHTDEYEADTEDDSYVTDDEFDETTSSIWKRAINSQLKMNNSRLVSPSRKKNNNKSMTNVLEVKSERKKKKKKKTAKQSSPSRQNSLVNAESRDSCKLGLFCFNEWFWSKYSF